MMAQPFSNRYSLSPIMNPGMITAEEEQLYYHLARTYWREDRIYLEFGTWLGRSTTRICQGLDDAAAGRWRLNCYDMFRWNADHAPKAERGGMPAAVAKLQTGDSFQEAFLTLMGDYRSRLTLFTGAVKDAPQLLKDAFAPDQKLGVLFVDASKGWDNGQLLKAVANHLTPGTRIVFQDFFMNSAIFLHLLLMLLPQLVPECYVTQGGSLVFRVEGAVSPDDPLFRPRSTDLLTVAAIQGACERLASVLPQSKYDAATLCLTLPVALWARGHHDEAWKAAARLTLTTAQRDIVRKRMVKHPVLDIPPIVSATS
jgi:predicted O-methyltransferase YrrM